MKEDGGLAVVMGKRCKTQLINSLRSWKVFTLFFNHQFFLDLMGGTKMANRHFGFIDAEENFEFRVFLKPAVESEFFEI